MFNFVDSLAERCGMRPERAQKGLEALLLTLRDRLPEESYDAILARLPETREMPTLTADRVRDQLDFWGSTLNDLSPHASAPIEVPLTALLTHLARAGISLYEAKRFLPITLQMMRRQLPPDLMRSIDRGVPGLSNFAALQSPGFLDRLRNLF
jgi:uncharacterized protein (DUF2267 family)